ncbi:MAG: YigZ family protein [Bacilli bacterium]
MILVIIIKTILEKVTYTYYVKESKFIAIMIPIVKEKNVKIIIDNIKKEYKKATHYCVGYIINGINRFDDNGEPNKTGGFPILNVLAKNNFNNCICIVVRYFGGTLLGTGGLIKAYSMGVKKCIENSKIIEMNVSKKIELSFAYNNIRIIEYLLSDFTIESKSFGEKIIFIVQIPINHNLIKLEKYCSIKIL